MFTRKHKSQEAVSLEPPSGGGGGGGRAQWVGTKSATIMAQDERRAAAELFGVQEDDGLYVLIAGIVLIGLTVLACCYCKVYDPIKHWCIKSYKKWCTRKPRAPRPPRPGAPPTPEVCPYPTHIHPVFGVPIDVGVDIGVCRVWLVTGFTGIFCDLSYWCTVRHRKSQLLWARADVVPRGTYTYNTFHFLTVEDPAARSRG